MDHASLAIDPTSTNVTPKIARPVRGAGLMSGHLVGKNAARLCPGRKVLLACELGEFCVSHERAISDRLAHTVFTKCVDAAVVGSQPCLARTVVDPIPLLLGAARPPGELAARSNDLPLQPFQRVRVVILVRQPLDLHDELVFALDHVVMYGRVLVAEQRM